MELSSRKTMKKPVEPVDEWLQNEGYYRKLGPRDSTCLFRAIAEQVYHNQRSHLRVREECVNYIRDNKQFFEEKTMIPVGSYCDQMVCITEWGGENEILAISLLYKRNVVIFDGQKLTKTTAIDHGYQENVFLCFTPPRQYETVYSQEYTSTAAFCQSVIYQILYKNVFKMNNVDVTVHKMLHERNHLRHDKFFLKGNIEIRDRLTNELLDKLVECEDNEELQLLDKGITPFPYRVAKALDPNIYRNIEYDIWHEIRKEVRNSGFVKFNSSELQNGAKCLVQIDFKERHEINNNFPIANNWDNSKALANPNGLEPLLYTGHIQDMSKNQGPVVVFVEELGQKVTVPYENLKPYPQRKLKQNNNWAIYPNKRNIINQNPKWKKPWNGPNRRLKDQMPSDANNNNNDKTQINNPKNVTKNLMNKSECTENLTAKVQNENYVTYKEYNTNSPVDNLKTSLENTHISVETVDETVSDKNTKININNDSHENSSKKQMMTNFHHEVNLANKQNRVEKNDIFYPPYPATTYHPIPRFPGDSEMANYNVTKNFDMKGNEVSCSDPATVRHFYNLGVKYYWSQNMWPNGTNGQSFNDNTYFVVHSSVAPDPNSHVNIMNGLAPNIENVSQQGNNNQNMRHNNRSSPPRNQDQNTNGPRSNNQKMNHRNSDFRNLTYQSSNTDNRNRSDSKNTNPNEQSQQGGNKEMQRGNKLNGVAPRFKRNYEGKNRNDYYNTQHQYRQQYQPDYDMRNKKQIDSQMMQNHGEVTDSAQHHQSQQPLNTMIHQQQSPHLVQQPPAMIQPQTSPPISSPYSYPVPFNQLSYVPIGSYPPESEAFPGPYYQAPSGYMQVPYLPASELPEQPIYQPVDSFNQYPPVYSQYMYPPPTAVYSNQPPPPEGCYPSFPGQSYFFPYPPPPLPPPGMQPANLTAPPTPQGTQ